MSRYWWLYSIALIVLILIGVTAYQNQKVYEEHKVNDERIVEDIDSIAGRLQMIIMQNDSIFNTLQKQSRLDTINIQELRGMRRELIKSNKRK
jgi:hypothetical protein